VRGITAEICSLLVDLRRVRMQLDSTRNLTSSCSTPSSFCRFSSTSSSCSTWVSATATETRPRDPFRTGLYSSSFPCLRSSARSTYFPAVGSFFFWFRGANAVEGFDSSAGGLYSFPGLALIPHAVRLGGGAPSTPRLLLLLLSEEEEAEPEARRFRNASWSIVKRRWREDRTGRERGMIDSVAPRCRGGGESESETVSGIKWMVFATWRK
jgi:hypothetical protein